MKHHNMNIMKIIGTSLMAGITVGYVGGQISKSANNMKKRTTKVVDNAGELINSVQKIFK